MPFTRPYYKLLNDGDEIIYTPSNFWRGHTIAVECDAETTINVQYRLSESLDYRDWPLGPIVGSYGEDKCVSQISSLKITCSGGQGKLVIIE